MPHHTEQQPSRNAVELEQINNNNNNGADHDYKLEIHEPQTSHKISQDSWFQVAMLGFSGTNSGFVLGYSGTTMVPLGWIGGVVGLMLAASISLYASVLIAKLHECGGKRHIRYRDLAGHIYGRKMYLLTWALQYLNLFMINTAYIILAGSATKGVYVLLSDDNGALKLPYCIAIAGFLCALFAISVPHLSALKFWLGISAFFSLVYIVIGLALSFKNGLEAPPRDYSIPVSGSAKVFRIIGAAANLVFSFNSGMLPEIQATIRQPAVGNMIKALYLVFTVISIPMYVVAFTGYWAYGSSTSSYLLNNVKGPVWVMAFANISALLQTVITLHIFASPMYEFFDTRLGNLKGSAMSIKNISFRIVVRGGYLAVTTLFAALLPFLGDFMSITGAVTVIPLTFILGNHMYVTVKGNEMGSVQKAWHWLNIIIFSVMSVVATVSAIKLIIVDSKTFYVFADM